MFVFWVVPLKKKKKAPDLHYKGVDMTGNFCVSHIFNWKEFLISDSCAGS